MNSYYADKGRVLELVGNRQWMSANNKLCNVSDMESSHIRNCIRWVRRNGIPASDAMVGMLEHELELRGADAPASRELEERYRSLCSIVRELFSYYRKHGEPAQVRRYERMLDDLAVDVR